MSGIKIITLILSLLACLPIWASPCAILLVPVPIGSDADARAQQEQFKEILKSTVESVKQSSLLNRSYTFNEALALVSSFLPAKQQEDFLNQAAIRFYSHKILTTRSNGFPRLKYSNRFLNWGADRGKTASVIWPENHINSQGELENLIRSTINVFSERALLPLRRNSVYMRSPHQLMAQNNEVLREKLLLQLFVLGPDLASHSPGPMALLWGQTKNILSVMIPRQFKEIRSLNLNQRHIDIFRAQGPEGLYNYLRVHEGLSFAIRYWYIHFANLKMALILTYAAVLAPQAFETWAYHANQMSFSTENALAHEQATVLLESMQSSSSSVMLKIEEDLAKLPQDERRALTILLNTSPTATSSSPN